MCLPQEIWQKLERKENIQKAISEVHSNIPLTKLSPDQCKFQLKLDEDSKIIPALDNRKYAISKKIKHESSATVCLPLPDVDQGK